LVPALLLVVAGAVLLFVGGEALVRGATAIALRAGLSPMVVGLTVVAFGTSCPELAVSLGAALDGHSDVALGNIVGSNIANIALVAALAAIIAPISTDRDLIRIDGPVLIGASVTLAGLIQFGSIPRLAGFLLLAVLIIYTVLRVVISRSSRKETDSEIGSSASILPMLLLTVGGVVGLAVGGNLLVDGALVLSRNLGLSEAVIGLTLLAVGTSLPEIATTVVAATRGASDLALGNAIGSCIYNILAVLGATVVVSPILVGDISIVDSAMMLSTALVCWIFIWTGHRFSRLEGAGFLCLYVAYFSWLFVR